MLMLRLWTAVFLLLALAGTQRAAADAPSAEISVERGHYVIKIASCNNCHTAGYVAHGGKIEEQRWLEGNDVGYRGEWGTTYAPNLRLYFARLSEDEWVQLARRIVTRPPMAWFVLQVMDESDLRSIYRFVKHLGPAGEVAPASLPPGVEPPGRYILYPRL